MPPLLARVAGPILIALTYVVMVAWTWGTWSDPLVDFGRELYVPWRILAGDRLYLDIAYFNGPLSPHLNALWFALGGTSLRTLFLANLAIVALVTWLLWQLVRAVASTLAATAGCLLFLLVFAFNQLLWVSIFNWVAPYSHEMTHGIALGLAALWCLVRHVRHGGRAALLGCGLCAGLGFLTKPETFVATAGALAVGCVLTTGEGNARAAVRRLLTLVAMVAGVAAVAFVGLLSRLPAEEALAGVLGGWRHVFNPALGGMRYYRDLLGIHDLDRTLRSAWQWALSLGIALLPAAGLVWFVRRRSREAVLGLAVLTAGTNIGLLLIARVLWSKVLQLVPFVLLAVAGFEAIRARRRDGAGRAGRAGLRAALCTFAVLLLLKVFLNVRVEHYGFGLAMPGAVLAAALLLDWIPRLLARRGHPLPFQAAAAVLLVAATASMLEDSQRHLDLKTEVVGNGQDQLHADVRGRAVREIMAEIRKLRAPGATLAVLPEGATLNFWLQMRNPTPFVNLMPPEVAMFGAGRILAAYQSNPPDFLVLAHKDTTEYGPRFFGTDYLSEMGLWIQQHYRPELGVGSQPFLDIRFGMLLLRRN